MPDRLIAALVAVKLTLFAGFLATLALVTPVAAQVSFGGGATAKEEVPDPTVCTGENLVTTIGREHPQAMARIDAAADATPYGYGRFWRLSKPDVAPSYLYGTMHVSDERATDLAPAVRARIAAADTVALEVKEIADPAAMQAKMAPLAAKSLYLDGTTLGSRLRPEHRDTLRAALEKEGRIPWAAAQRMRPWLLMSAMLVPSCESARKAEGRPIVDRLIADLAAEAGRPLIGLETVESQVETLAGLPEPVMLRALANVASLGPRIDDVFETSVALYETGEIAKLWALMQDPAFDGGTSVETDAERAEGYAAFQGRVIDARNATMVEALEPLLAAGNAFAAVGALHLPGERGMLRMLERRGWRVSPME